MKRLYVILFASLITLAVLSACGVEQTPATATDAPAPFSEAPETEEFATTIPVVGEDYTLSSVEISGAYTYISHGPIMKCLDEQAMNQGTHYAAYTVENGELVELERHTFSQVYELDGITYPMDFEWCMNDGLLEIPYCGENCRPYAWYTYRAAPERVFVMVSHDDTTFAYPLIINLLTGEMEDVLSDVELENMSNVDVSQDGSRLLIVCRSEENYEDTTVWLYDIAAKALSDITDISPSSMGGFFAGESVICAYDPEGVIRRCDLDAEELDEVYNVKTSDEGAEILYDMTASRYILLYSAGELSAVDVAGGGVMDVGAVPAKPGLVQYSPDGTRALLMFSDGDTVSGLYVVDFTAQTLADYLVPVDFAVSAYEHASPEISWFDNGTFALGNGANGVDDALRVWAYELQTQSGESQDEVWVYPESAAYSNTELNIAIDFPEAWTGHLALLEQYGAEPSVTVCCRELLENELTPEYSIIFAVLSADKNDLAALRRFDDPECFTFLGERGDLVYYYSNAYGRIKASELWYKDVWENNESLLADMATQYDTLMDSVDIAD